MSFFSASAIAQSSRSSLGQLFFRRVNELGCRTFLKIQQRGSFEDKSWRDFGAMVQSTLLGLNELGWPKGIMSRLWATTVLGAAQSLSMLLLPEGCSLLTRNCLFFRMLLFLTTAPKSFAAVCHLPSCWSGADVVISTNWINCWKQSSQVI
jgi:hypothetical protein